MVTAHMVIVSALKLFIACGCDVTSLVTLVYGIVYGQLYTYLVVGELSFFPEPVSLGWE